MNLFIIQLLECKFHGLRAKIRKEFLYNTYEKRHLNLDDVEL